MPAKFESLSYRVDGKIARLTLDRTDLLNAMHYQSVSELDTVTTIIAEDPDIKIVAISGAGRAFSTGIDLKDLSAGKIDMTYHVPWERALRRLETMEKIVLCQIHGYALGGGLQLALACDIRASTPSAQLGLPAIKEGLIPGLGTFRLARYIGMGRAKKLILSGDMVSGEQALNIGLVDHLLNEELVAEEFEKLIQKYLQTNSQGCRFSKRLLVDSFDLNFTQFHDRYMESQTKAMSSDDFHEAMAAYREKRTPVWK